MTRLVLLMIALLGVGCGLHHTVNSDVFKDMSVDKKLRLFEAENDVSIADDEREQMRERIREIKSDMHAANQEERAASRADDDKEAALAVHMWEVRGEFLKESLAYLRDRMDGQEAAIDVARAKFELAKALLIKKNKLAGADGIDVKDFQAQVRTYTDRLHQVMVEVERRKPHLQKTRAEWLKLRDEFAAGSLQGSTIPGADEIPVWESW